MQKITRRAALSGIAAISATGAAGAAIAEAKAQSTDERINAALAELQAAVQAKYPNWRVQVRNDIQHARIGSELRRDPNPHCQAILVYTSDERYGPEEARWFRNYL